MLMLQHITGDISFAVEQYWRITKDLNWLKSLGFPILNESANFYASRVEKYENQYTINGVIPPGNLSY